MNKTKAIICTLTLAVVVGGIMAYSFTIYYDSLGINLYQLATGVIANIWLGNMFAKFYNLLSH
jgi:hypothetical protein